MLLKALLPRQNLPRLVLLFWAAGLLCCGTALAQVRLEAPERAARGDAFLAQAVSDRQTRDFVFHWLGKNYTASAVVLSPGAADREQWRAEILLPVPLDARGQSLELGVSAGAGQSTDQGTDQGAGQGADQGAAAPVKRARIALYDKKRPVQKLSVDKKYVNPPVAQQARIKADREKVRQALAQRLPQRLWTLPFTRPVPGGVSSLFGMKRVFNGQPRSVHRGLDLRGAQGTPILACADGQVALADNLYFSGNAVYINHGEGVFSAYLHMSESEVSLGQRVRKGQVIGLVGATGRVTGPHLHLSLIVQGVSVDPQPFLAARSSAPMAPDVQPSQPATMGKQSR